MPYHGKDIRSSPVFQSHKAGRYVTDSQGFLRGVDGDSVDLHAFLTQHSPHIQIMPILTKIMRASGLHPGGFALVSRSVPTKSGSLVVVRVNSETITRQLLKREDGWYLIADDPREREIKITEDLIVEKVGVVIAAIVKY